MTIRMKKFAYYNTEIRLLECRLVYKPREKTEIFESICSNASVYVNINYHRNVFSWSGITLNLPGK